MAIATVELFSACLQWTMARRSPVLKESKLCQWAAMWECPLIDIKAFLIGEVSFHGTSGGWSALGNSGLWTLSTASQLLNALGYLSLEELAKKAVTGCPSQNESFLLCVLLCHQS